MTRCAVLLATLAFTMGCNQAQQEQELPPEPVDPSLVATVTPFPWPSFDEAVATGISEKKHILIDIYAPWCGWCARMQEEVYGNPTLAAYVHQNFAFGRLNIDDVTTQHSFMGHVFTSSELGAALGAQGTPTTVFLDDQGAYITRLPGYMALEPFGDALRYIATRGYLQEMEPPQESVNP